jgi:hypothetical protein
MPIFMPDFAPIDVRVKPDPDPLNSGRTRLVPVFSDVGTTRVDLQTMTIPLANDRSTVLNAAVANQFKVIQAANDRVSELNLALQELQRISPTGVNDQKQANVDVPGASIGQNISRQAWDILATVTDATGASVQSLFVGAEIGQQAQLTVVGLNAGKTFSQATTIMKSAVDQASQNNQLEMTTLQGLTNKFNQSIETMSDLVSKFTDLNGKLAGMFRPLR